MIDGHASLSSAWDRALGALKGQGSYHAPAPQATQLDKPPAPGVPCNFELQAQFNAGRRQSREQLDAAEGNSLITDSLSMIAGAKGQQAAPENFKLIDGDF